MSAEPVLPLENEITLAIVSDRPADVAQEIAQTRSIEGYSLSDTDAVTFHDLYFDTPGADLGKCRSALRLRLAGSSIRIAFKGPDRLAAHGGLERPEIDVVWSRDALDRLAAALSRLGANFNSDRFFQNDPESTLEASGMQLIQRRHTLRMQKKVFLRSGGEAVAEMAIDRVTYDLPSGKIDHWEIEIEASCADGLPALTTVAARLLQRFGDRLRIWNYGKLATGAALRDLLQAGATTELIGKDHTLRAEAYSSIEAFLQSAVHGSLGPH